MLAAIALAVLIKHEPIHVEGNRLMADGKPVILRGVILPGLETAEGGDNVFRSLRVAAEDWKVNCVVIPLSQDRWAGKIKGEKEHGEEYRGMVDDLLTYVQKNGLYAIVQLASSDEGKWGQNMGPHEMPDKNSEEFWRQIARRYGGYENVLFDLYAEPHGVDDRTWLDGGPVGTAYETPGFQFLINDIRKSGSSNVIVVDCLDGRVDGGTSSLKDSGKGRGLTFELPRAYASEIGSFKPLHFSELKESAPIVAGPAATLTTLTFLVEPRIGQILGAMEPGSSLSLIKDWEYTPTTEGEQIKKWLAASAN